jgi:o-succinylbenzoate synthase
MGHVLARIELLLVHLPLARPFTTSSHTKDHLEHILVRVTDSSGGVGWGECASPSDPFYCPETVETCWHMLRDFIGPMVLGKSWNTPEEAAQYWALVRGNAFARAGLEMACWDLFARARGISVAEALGGSRPEIESGVSLSIERSVDDLLGQVERFVGEGYRRMKLKVGPGKDVSVVEAVRSRFPRVPLMVDANGVYDLENPSHVASLQALDRFDLMMVEQPLDYDDIVDHARLQAMLQTRVCLDESIHTAQDGRKALDLKACRVINIKAPRVGGLAEAKRLHDVCQARGIPVWCGGMHEFGIGRAANVALSSLPGFTIPGDVSGSDRAYPIDIVDPPIRAVGGAIAVPFDRPGLGFEPNMQRIEAHLTRRETLAPD